MKEEIKNKWVAALRSGDYEQTKHTLKDKKGFCCLGVLCDLYSPNQWESFSDENNCYNYRFSAVDIIGELLPSGIMEWSGMKSDDGKRGGYQRLSSINDKGVPFENIADIIEEEWEKL